MIGECLTRYLLTLALKESAADQTEVIVSSGRWALTRFANSTIHQNMASDEANIRVRAVFGKRVASASTNRANKEGVLALVSQVVEMARLQDENPDFVSLPGPDGGAPSVDAFSDSTAESTPEQRAEAVKAIVSETNRIGGTAAGSMAVGVEEVAVMNSLGADAFHRGTSSSLTTVVTGPDGGFGYGMAEARDVSAIDPLALGKEAADRAYASRNPADLEPGEYECILLPYAVQDMIDFLAWMGFSARMYQDGRSFVCGKLGRKIVSDKVSLWDDGLDPRTIVHPFDGEGVAKQRVDLIKDGVGDALLYDSYTAHREGKKSTGHAPGGSPRNLIMAPGDATLDDMISSTKRGLLVTRFHYTNIAHLMTASITGMTRDGTFLIENGRITEPVKNLRFTQSITEALSSLDMVGSELKLVDGVLCPAIKVGKFRFSSATEF